MTDEDTQEEIETVIPEVMPDSELIPMKIASNLENVDVHGFELMFNSDSNSPPSDDTMKTIALAAIIGGTAMVGLGMLLLKEANKNKPLISSKSKLPDNIAIEGDK